MENEKRLIDADDLMKSIKSFRWFGVPNTLKLMFDYLKIIINEQPTIEATPVVHGHWREYNRSALVSWKNGEPVWVDRAVYYCDGCGFGTIIKHNYCSRCGAKMARGVSDG